MLIKPLQRASVGRSEFTDRYSCTKLVLNLNTYGIIQLIWILLNLDHTVDCSRFILLKNILKIRTLTRTKFSIFAVVLYDNPTEIIFCCYSLNLLTYPGRIASY